MSYLNRQAVQMVLIRTPLTMLGDREATLTLLKMIDAVLTLARLGYARTSGRWTCRCGH